MKYCNSQDYTQLIGVMLFKINGLNFIDMKKWSKKVQVFPN